jgi:MOSC domain-containing protein YiiM
MMTAKIIAVCSSQEKGTRKRAVDEGIIREDYGLIGDAHADYCTHRQVSLLAGESIDKLRALGLNVGPGAFAENITTSGIDLVSLPIGTRISIGEAVLLEVTQIGKECHAPCAIYRQAGMCVMPTEGIFARVIRGGVAKVEDPIKVESGG